MPMFSRSPEDRGLQERLLHTPVPAQGSPRPPRASERAWASLSAGFPLSWKPCGPWEPSVGLPPISPFSVPLETLPPARGQRGAEDVLLRAAVPFVEAALLCHALCCCCTGLCSPDMSGIFNVSPGACEHRSGCDAGRATAGAWRTEACVLPAGPKPGGRRPADWRALAHRAVTGQHHSAPPALGGRGAPVGLSRVFTKKTISESPSILTHSGTQLDRQKQKQCRLLKISSLAWSNGFQT